MSVADQFRFWTYNFSISLMQSQYKPEYQINLIQWQIPVYSSKRNIRSWTIGNNACLHHLSLYIPYIHYQLNHDVKYYRSLDSIVSIKHAMYNHWSTNWDNLNGQDMMIECKLWINLLIHELYSWKCTKAKANHHHHHPGCQISTNSNFYIIAMARNFTIKISKPAYAHKYDDICKCAWVKPTYIIISVLNKC